MFIGDLFSPPTMDPTDSFPAPHDGAVRISVVPPEPYSDTVKDSLYLNTTFPNFSSSSGFSDTPSSLSSGFSDTPSSLSSGFSDMPSPMSPLASLDDFYSATNSPVSPTVMRSFERVQIHSPVTDSVQGSCPPSPETSLLLLPDQDLRGRPTSLSPISSRSPSREPSAMYTLQLEGVFNTPSPTLSSIELGGTYGREEIYLHSPAFKTFPSHDSPIPQGIDPREIYPTYQSIGPQRNQHGYSHGTSESVTSSRRGSESRGSPYPLRTRDVSESGALFLDVPNTLTRRKSAPGPRPSARSLSGVSRHKTVSHASNHKASLSVGNSPHNPLASPLEFPSKIARPVDPLDTTIDLGAVVHSKVGTPNLHDAAASRRIHPAKYSCPYCKQTMTTSHNLRNHINSHMGHRPHACQHCRKFFTTQTTRNRHQKRCEKKSPK